MKKAGTSSSMPARRPSWSPIQPMIGRITSPGMTHSDATENPIDRARGGMATASTAKMPGRRMASTAMIDGVGDDGHDEVGRQGEDDQAGRHDHAVWVRNPRTAAGPLASRRVAMRAPTIRPTS